MLQIIEPQPKAFHKKKKWIFLSNPYINLVMTTSLIEMAELPDFENITASTI